MKGKSFGKVLGAVALMVLFTGTVFSALSGLGGQEIEQKVKDTLGKMTFDEKIAQMHGVVPLGRAVGLIGESLNPALADTWNTAENKRLGIPALRCIDGPRGVGKGWATAFPVSMSRGASWDPVLERRIGEAMGYEARAQNANVLLSPCINLLRHPSWGRAQETYGEDPLHLGVMGSAHIIGAQKYVMACAKHFAANNMEESRFFVNAVMDERTLREVYLPHFKMCVDAGVASVMSAYNDLNGFLAGQNKHLITDILKDDWGFKGFVVSDWENAVDDAVLAGNAGLDLEMPMGAHLGEPLKKAIEEGKVPAKNIDDSVARLLRMKYAFLTPDFTKGFDKSKVGGKGHAQIALEAAQKGTVLLKNDKNALPLDRGKIKTLVVIGKLANTKNIGDHGSSDVATSYAVTPLQGILSKAGTGIKVVYELGADLEKAKQAAQGADAVIIVAGMTWKDEGEGGPGYGDRKDLNLHKDDEALIKAVAGVTDRLIVVLEAGAVITLESWKNDAEAIVMAWYPGMEGGNGLADLLFGDVNFSGKLPIVWGKSLDQYPPFDNKAREVKIDYYHGYRLFDKKGLEPSFPFGYGLSYTKYKYSNLKLDQKQIGKSGKVTASVDLANTGKMAGEEIVQLYVGSNGSKVDRPVKDLKAFTRVALKPGETKTVTLEVNAQDLAYWNMDKNGWEIEEIEYTVLVGPSSRANDLGLKGSFKISGN